MATTRRERVAALETCTAPFLRMLTRIHAEAGGVTEIRVLGRGGVYVARIGPDDVDAIVDALRPVTDVPRARVPDGDHPRTGEANVYFCMGAVQPDASRPTGAVFRRTKRAAKDAEIVAYPFVVVDIDPERLPRDRASRDAEKDAARSVAESIRAELAERGVPTALADSGNGFHLVARQTVTVGTEAVKACSDAMRRVLHDLNARHSTASARVDVSTHNRSRIMKLYGTVATKGEDTADTPHRLSWIDVTAIPEPRDVLARLAPRPEPPPPARPQERARRAERPNPARPAQRDWRAAALAATDLSTVYGEWLTGCDRGNGWLECRDPASPSGDRNPSAGVADGSGQAERGTFHSFRTSESCSLFDFLVRVGRVADIGSALRLVADLSGVPLPPRRGRGEPPALDAFAEHWNATSDEAARSRALDAALRQALDLAPIAQEQAFEQIRAAAGLSAGSMRSAIAATKDAIRRERAQARATPPASRPCTQVVRYVVNTDSLEALYDSLLGVMLPVERFFQRGTDLVYVRRERGPVVLSEYNLPGILSSFLELAIFRATADGVVFERYDALSGALARAFLAAPHVAVRFPVLVGYVRSPVFDASWRLVARFGYHAESGLFYDGPPIVPREGSEALDRALTGFRWKADADRVNFVGALLTALTMPSWGRGHPFLAINGNKAGVGKTTLARTLAAIAEGSEPSAISFIANEDEMEKQLATRIDAGDRIVIVDNAKTSAPISSAVLERSITAPRLVFRRLGSNSEIARAQNDVLFVLTMNMTQLGPDLRRRALPLNLEVTGNVRHAGYTVDDPVGAVLAARADILGELAGMVVRWVEAGMPVPEDAATHSTSAAWARQVDGILRHAGMLGFLSNQAESEHAFDPDYDALREVCEEHHELGFLTCTEWAPYLAFGPLGERLRDRQGNPRSARSQATVLGILFGHYVGETFEVGGEVFTLDERVERKGHPPFYGFVRP